MPRMNPIAVLATAVVAVSLFPSLSIADVPNPSLYPGISGGGNMVLGEWDINETDDTNDKQISGENSGIVKLRVGRQFTPRFAIEVGAGMVPFTAGNTERNTAFIYDLDAVLHLMKGNFSPFIVVGAGGYHNLSGDLGSDIDPQLHLGIGVRGMITDWLAIRAEARDVMTDGLEDGSLPFASNLEITGGLDFFFGAIQRGPADRDKDGVPDLDDRCPDTMGLTELNGCPDADHDGIADDQDKCPSDPETVNGFSDEDGCPDEIPDTDGDGLKDDVDKCIDAAEDKDGFQDDDGCPDNDNDEDGVMDRRDKCPLEAGPRENRGCPDTDRDNDGVIDRLDNCPDEPGIARNQGCAAKQLVALSAEKIEILDMVYFDTNKATIQKRSFKLLNNIYVVLSKHPEIDKIRIEGHTDSQGADEANKKLSQDRADSVKAFLVKKGIEAERLVAIGFGEEKPIASNDTPKGRAANRRVEFNIVQE